MRVSELPHLGELQRPEKEAPLFSRPTPSPGGVAKPAWILGFRPTPPFSHLRPWGNLGPDHL